jgi:hypothetical protein
MDRIEKIDRFQDGSNSPKDHFPAFKMIIPIIRISGSESLHTPTRSSSELWLRRAPIANRGDTLTD